MSSLSVMEIGKIVHSFESCSSTNDLAREMALQGAEEGTVIISEEQTAGRGTKGRIWYSPRKRGLYTSIILRPEQPSISLLPLVAGLGARQAIFEATGLQVGLKWPNDLVWEGKKLGGILCESGFLGNHLNYVIMGIGLNISQERTDFPPQIRSRATSLKLAKKEEIDRDSLIQNLWKTLNSWYGLFCQGRKDEIICAFEGNLVFSRGERITVVKPEEEVSGFFAGIDSQGGLILDVQGRRLSFYSAEIQTIEYE